MKQFSVAIVGATGLVGTTTLGILEERKFPIKQLYLLASKRSAGETRQYHNKPHTIEALDDFDFSQADIAFFCINNEISEKYAPIAAKAGCVVIDKSSCFRYEPEVPLVVPEVNLDALAQYKKKNIIANANCNVIPIAVAVKPIFDAVGIKHMTVSTYQSVSGTGKDAVTELTTQTLQILNDEPIHPAVYPQQIAFNVLPHIDAFQDNHYTREEMKLVWELQKIFSDPTLAINPTAVRVPVVCGHSAAVALETKDKLSIDQAIKLIQGAPGVKVVTGKFPYPTPVQDAAGNDFVHVGRIRKDLTKENGINLWIVADNLRKGAALNAIQVAEELTRNYL